MIAVFGGVLTVFGYLYAREHDPTGDPELWTTTELQVSASATRTPTGTPTPIARPVPDDVCAFIGEDLLREQVPGAESRSFPGSSIDGHQSVSCEAVNPDGRGLLAIYIDRFSDAEPAVAAKSASAEFNQTCDELAASEGQAVPELYIPEKVCSRSNNASLDITVLKDEHIVDLTVSARPAEDAESVDRRAFKVMKHIFKRLETLVPTPE